MDIKPTRLARYGTFIVCLLFLLSLGIASILKYPETIDTTAILRAVNAPKPVWIYQSGKLIRLFKTNGQTVNTNELIGCMETTASWQEVVELSNDIDTLCTALEKGENHKTTQIMNKFRGHLGELQADYQSFVQEYIAFEAYVLGGYADKKRALLQKDLHLIGRSKGVIAQQSNLYAQDITLSQTNLDNNKALLDENVISQQEYRELISQNISKKMTVPQIQSNYIGSDAQLNDKAKELLELDNQIANQLKSFRQSAYRFKNSIDTWKHNFLLIASTNGVLSYTTFVQEKQILEAGNAIGYITPSNNEYYLQTAIPQNSIGKVALGQKVLLKFSAWQWQEYGSVIGKVDYVSSIPSDSGYITKIILPNGLSTNYKKQIIYKEGLMANAQIITKDITLLKRLYNSLIHVTEK